MSLYLTLKYVHILGAAVWFGGGVAATILGARIPRLDDPAARVVAQEQLEVLARRLFGPAAAVTVLAGIAAALRGGIPMSSLWLVWGYAGVVVSGVLGGGMTQRASRALQEVVASEGPSTSAAVALGQRLQRLALLNLLVLASVIWAMVVKPTL